MARRRCCGPTGDRPHRGWNEPTNRAAAVVRAEPAGLAAGIAERLSPPRGTGWPDAWLEADAAARSALDAGLAEIEGPSEPGLAAALGAAYFDGDLVYTASSMPIRDQEAFLPPSDADVLFLANRGANGIDGLLSSGIGAAQASGRPTVIVTGDLGLLHDLGGLAALREVTTPVRIVVVNNDGGGIFHFLPQEEAMKEAEFEALLGTPRGVDVGGAAALFGLEHREIGDLGELAGGAESRDGSDRGQGGPGRERRDPPPPRRRRRRCAAAPTGPNCTIGPYSGPNVKFGG